MAIMTWEYDAKNICLGCKYLLLDDGQDFYGTCISRKTKVKNRDRDVTNKACVCKKVEVK